MSVLKDTKFILDKYHIYANKSLGQNFLVDDDSVSGIIESANISKDDLIIEIGPGLGTITKELLDRAGRVVCIELDERMIGILNDRFALYDNFKIINEDVLKVDLNQLIKEEKIKNTKIVANLPYYITTPIIMKLLEEKLDIDTITVMIQKEVAERLVAEPGKGESGAITYAIHYYTKPRVVLQVPNTAFIPEPKVNSTVIQLEVQKKPTVEVEDEIKLFDLIRVSFMQKRKTLVNAIANSNKYGDKETIEKTISEMGLDTRIRPEKLTLEQYARLSEHLNCQGA